MSKPVPLFKSVVSLLIPTLVPIIFSNAGFGCLNAVLPNVSLLNATSLTLKLSNSAAIYAESGRNEKSTLWLIYNSSIVFCIESNLPKPKFLCLFQT